MAWAPGISAQHDLGLNTNHDVSYATRAGVGPAAGAALKRLDRDDLLEWGPDAANPGKRSILGIAFVIQDFDVTSTDPFYMVVYGEDAQNADFPDPQKQFGRVGPFGLPATNPGNIPSFPALAFTVRQVFATPVLADAGEDTFIGCEFNAGFSATDGLAMWDSSSDPTIPTFESPGPAPIGQANYECALPNGGAGQYFGPDIFDLRCSPLVATAAGTCLAVTNQASYPLANTAPGTASLISGYHPDTASVPTNPGRADDLAFQVEHSNAVLWFFTFSFGANPFGPQSVDSILRGSTGNVCVDPTQVTVAAIVPAGTSGEAQYVLTLPPAARAFITNVAAPFDVVWQGFGIDAGGQFVHGSNCAVQHLK